MNVSNTIMPRFLSSTLVLLLLNIGLWAQQNKPYETNNVISGSTFYKSYYSAGVSTITKAPTNALSYGLSTTVGNITFHYKPKANFLGKDYVVIEYYPTYPGSPSYIGLELVVLKSVLITKVDYITANKNQTIDINVLSNDSTSAPSLTLSSEVPFTSHCSATKSGNQIHFVPETDFVGVANVNYLACDAQNTCRVGTVIVKVLPDNLEINDTLKYTLSKNTHSNIFIGLTGYDGITKNPSHGTLSDVANDVVKYTPSTDYTGLDTFKLYKVINNTTYYKNVICQVFNVNASNKYAIDDYAATPKATPVTFNLLANDIGNYVLINPASMTSPNGTIQYLGSGNVKFTPNSNFTGTASFNYKIGFPGFNTVVETGKAFVEVSNQLPVSTIYNLSTPEETPLIIKYFVPFSGWSFTIEEQPDHGTMAVYPGQQTITLENQTVSGYNMVVYTPNTGFSNGDDAFSLKYCTGSNVCSIVKFEVFVKDIPNPQDDYCVGDCVWAGDTDGDGIVNVKDILPVAMCMGIPGEQRDNPTIDWEAQFGADWANPYENSPVDLKHIDTNGDGLITLSDTAAINQSYGNIHQLPNNSVTKLGDKNIIFVPRDTILTPGDDAIIDIHFGIENKPVYEAHGFTFKFDYINHPLITPDKIHTIFNEDNWLVKDASSLTMSKIPQNGNLHVAYARTGGNPMTGFGQVGLVIVEDLEGIKSDDQGYLTFKITDISYLNDNGEYIQIPDQTVAFKFGKKNTPLSISDSDVVLYPNPAKDLLNISVSSGIKINNTRLFSLTGQLCKSSANGEPIDVSSLSSGLYLLQIETNAGMLTKKFEKLN